MAVIQEHRYNVFLASPSDTEDERALVREVVVEVNAFLAASDNRITLNVLPWESLPTGGHLLGPQHYIYQRYPVGTWDIVVGILKKKFGSPKPALSNRSNTEDEILSAHELWTQSGHPLMHLYFSAENIAATPDEKEELSKILALKEKLQRSHLTFTFSSVDELRKKLFNDLWDSAQNLRRKEQSNGLNDFLRCQVDATPVVALSRGCHGAHFRNYADVFRWQARSRRRRVVLLQHRTLDESVGEYNKCNVRRA